jgi:hypothetical protein
MSMATLRFTPADQRAFARLSGDFNPVHQDPVAARRTVAGEPIVTACIFCFVRSRGISNLGDQYPLWRFQPDSSIPRRSATRSPWNGMGGRALLSRSMEPSSRRRHR